MVLISFWFDGKCGSNKWHMVLDLNHVIDDTLNLLDASCCRVVSTLKFGFPQRFPLSKKKKIFLILWAFLKLIHVMIIQAKESYQQWGPYDIDEDVMESYYQQWGLYDIDVFNLEDRKIAHDSILTPFSEVHAIFNLDFTNIYVKSCICLSLFGCSVPSLVGFIIWVMPLNSK